MQNIKLSIIIPYYNTYDYTIKLLKELSIQKTDEVEVILVDDGCNETRFDEFTEFKIIHLDKNYGASYAWNRGIEASQGAYIGFIDSDDMIMMNYIEVLLDAIGKYDYDEILFDWIDLNKNRHVKTPKNRGIWKAIYRRNICPMFDEDWKFCTDIPFQAKLKNIPHTQYYLPITLYVYRSVRENSITWNRVHRKFEHPNNPWIQSKKYENINNRIWNSRA